MGKSKIEWTDAVWNPVTGCTKVSEGCRNCYAERMAKRLAGRVGYSAELPFSVTWHVERMGEPLQWKKPRRVFVCSMGDLFHERVPDEVIYDVFEVMIRAPQHTYMVLTKRAQRMQAFMSGSMEFVQENIWLGVSVENQAAADERVHWLLDTPAAMRFVSCEPLLGPVDLGDCDLGNGWRVDALNGTHWGPGMVDYQAGCTKLDWVIVGGESGPGARPMHPNWARALRDDCGADRADCPFFFKQWGEWLYEDQLRGAGFTSLPKVQTVRTIGGYTYYRVGKKAAGRALDENKGWTEIPCKCEHKGCGSRSAEHYEGGFGETMWISGNWCYEHAKKHGFCPRCGWLCAGEESFEASQTGLCDECLEWMDLNDGEEELGDGQE